MSITFFRKSFIANTVTSLNVFCGFVSLVFASEGDFKTASVFIMAAATFDLLDGIVARLLGTTSRFGVELDSLSDVVSFGAAPSFLIYKAYAFQFGYWGIILSSLLLVFGALRLARFNIQVEDLKTKGDFTGLPIPMAAMTIAMLILSAYRNGEIIPPYQTITIPLILLLALLMVSKIRYNAFPNFKDRKLKEKLLGLTVVIIALILSIVTNGEVLFLIFLGIVIFGVLRHFYNYFTGKKK
jgi:CDP-diacylglycerol---serine O-phosphatidyltransferase